MHFTITITIDHRPYPVNIIRYFGINTEFVAFGTAIAERGNTEYGPGVIWFGGVTTHQWPSRITGTRVDASTFVASTEHIFGYGIIIVNGSTIVHRYNGYFGLMQNTGTGYITISSFTPTNDGTFDILRQRLIGFRQAGETYPSGSVNGFGKSRWKEKNVRHVFLENSKYIRSPKNTHFNRATSLSTVFLSKLGCL